MAAVLIVFFFVSYNIVAPVGPGLYTSLSFLYQDISILLAATTVITIVLVLLRLRIQGTSKDLKEKVLRRHILYFALYCVYLLQLLQHFNSYWLKKLMTEGAFYWVGACFNVIGVLLAATRLAEPFVWNNFKADFLRLCGCREQVKCKRIRFSKESLDSFLNSALNIEYVYMILMGIRSFNEQSKGGVKGNKI